MQIIISPAKRMKVDPDSFPVEGLPVFLEKTQRLKTALQSMSPSELKTLWRCNDAIATQNVERLQHMDLCRHLTPSILAYEGIQYRYMAPGVLERTSLDYLRAHLRILSGFYGLLAPFDGVVPYRLEMQARLSVDGYRDLYHFWGDSLARRLSDETDLVVNLASREYSRAVEPHLPGSVTFLTCTFGQRQGEKLLEKGTLCKMARGQMVRWLAQNQITDPLRLREFSDLGYRFSPDLSTSHHYVFLMDAPASAESFP